MEKVKVTREQAECIKSFENNKVVALKHWVTDSFEVSKCLKKLTLDELARCLYSEEGYEVEEEFKVGDWVNFEDDTCSDCITKIIDIQPIYNRVQYYGVSGWQNINSIQRHATPSEIAQEKERRWWGKHGRDVNEYRLNDIVKIKNDSQTIIAAVEGVADDQISDEGGDAWLFGEIELICPAENRLDGDGSE